MSSATDKITELSRADAAVLTGLYAGRVTVLIGGRVVIARERRAKSDDLKGCMACILQHGSQACRAVSCPGIVFANPTLEDFRKAPIAVTESRPELTKAFWLACPDCTITVSAEGFRGKKVDVHDKSQWKPVPADSLLTGIENPLKNWCRKNKIGLCAFARQLGLSSWYQAAALWRVRVLHPETFQACAALMGISTEELTQQYEFWYMSKDAFRKTPPPKKHKPAGAIAKMKKD